MKSQSDRAVAMTAVNNSIEALGYCDIFHRTTNESIQFVETVLRTVLDRDEDYFQSLWSCGHFQRFQEMLTDFRKQLA